MPWLLALAAFALLAASSSKKTATPSVTGLIPGAWYRLVVRSTFCQGTWNLDAARQQLQALLGRQGFDLRDLAPDPADPCVYSVVGVYRAGDGVIHDVPGAIVLRSGPGTPTSGPKPNVMTIEDRPVPVVQGVTYFGRGSIPWPISMVVGAGTIASKLKDAGFTDVQVWTDASQLPASWPSTERGGDAFATGVYSGDGSTLPLPSQVISVWTDTDQP